MIMKLEEYIFLIKYNNTRNIIIRNIIIFY